MKLIYFIFRNYYLLRKGYSQTFISDTRAALRQEEEEEEGEEPLVLEGTPEQIARIRRMTEAIDRAWEELAVNDGEVTVEESRAKEEEEDYSAESEGVTVVGKAVEEEGKKKEKGVVVSRLPVKPKKQEEKVLLTFNPENITEEEKQVYEEEEKKCGECSKSITECNECLREAEELIEKGEVKQTWESNENLRPCIAKKLLERRNKEK